jgi:potassium efflux system protein
LLKKRRIFNSSSIDVRVYFWTKDFREAAAIKSDVIIAVTTVFRENNIKIPFPQQEIYVQQQTAGPTAKRDRENI